MLVLTADYDNCCRSVRQQYGIGKIFYSVQKHTDIMQVIILTGRYLLLFGSQNTNSMQLAHDYHKT